MRNFPVQFGRYTLLEELGSGAFGTVYKASDRLGRSVAIKVLKPSMYSNPETISRFIESTRIAGMLFHHRVVTILDFDEVDGRVFFAMRLISGPSLDKVIRQSGALSFHKTVSLFTEISEALTYAHGHGVVHGDVKPANVICSPEGAVLTDFSLMQIAASSTLDLGTDVMGTPPYMAPELWQDKPITPKTDLYALGCVLYEMLTGKILFYGESVTEIRSQHFFPIKLPEFLPLGVPQEVKPLLQSMLAQEPEKRPSSVLECADKLRTLSADETSLLKPFNTSTPLAMKMSNSFSIDKLDGSSTIRILFLAANPKGTPSLRLDEEMREIEQVLQESKFRERFETKQYSAVRVRDVQKYLMRHKPHIVHFSGHGSPDSEIILEDNEGMSRPVPVRALMTLFEHLKDDIKCVVLNACYSDRQAKAIAQNVDFVVGMTKAIGDTSAIAFAAAFYQALGFGRDIQTAFNLGCVQIDMDSLNEQTVPQLLINGVGCKPTG